jgi:pyruvate/2-oxoglutarate dehydrogenase complex dihydrolipoamide acyltransferase (E2) component
MLGAIERAAAAPTPVSAPVQMRAPSPADDAAREERVHMTRLRQTIARRLKDAQNTAAMLTTFNEVDMTAVMHLRNQYKDLFEKKHGVKLGFMGFFVRACIQALKEIPAVNAEIDGTDIVYKNYYQSALRSGRTAAWSCLSSAMRTRCRSRKLKKLSPIWAGARARVRSRSKKCRAGPSPSAMAASMAR